jgi:hypothetical protein
MQHVRLAGSKHVANSGGEIFQERDQGKGGGVRQWEKEVRKLTDVEEEDLDIHQGRPEVTRPTLGVR